MGANGGCVSDVACTHGEGSYVCFSRRTQATERASGYTSRRVSRRSQTRQASAHQKCLTHSPSETAAVPGIHPSCAKNLPHRSFHGFFPSIIAPSPVPEGFYPSKPIYLASRMTWRKQMRKHAGVSPHFTPDGARLLRLRNRARV
jgi:hypothetical protein